MKIGVISDTHNFGDPQIAGCFAGVGHILHAGDIGQPRILAELEAIAPVTAVAGNTDDPALGYPMTKSVILASRKFFVQHIVHPHDVKQGRTPNFEGGQPDVVVFGHTHQRFYETLGGVLYFNPGYAGRPRWGQERSAAILYCDEKGIRAEFFGL